MTTYLDLTNRLLRRINEVEITDSQFSSVRGLQAAAKDAILDAVREINNRKNYWIFNAESGSQLLTVGQEEYTWPADFASVDWNSFYIEKDDTIGNNTLPLIPINRTEWYSKYRPLDFDTGSTGRSTPTYVFASASGGGWGISPSPLEANTVKFRYYKIPTDLSASTDVCNIPSRFDYVIIAGGLYHLNLFKDNAESTMISEKTFYRGIADMVRQVISWPVKADDTRIQTTWGYGYDG